MKSEILSITSYEPLKITAILRNDVVCDRYLPLDGILYYHAYRRLYGPPIILLSGQALDHEIELPFLRLEGNVPDFFSGESRPEWYYACSWAQPQPHSTGSGQAWWLAEGKSYWNKRLDTEFIQRVDRQGRRGRLLIEGGRYKIKHMPVFYYVARRIEWFCVGDHQVIEKLLSLITHIGKYKDQGWGRVVAWKVQSWHADWSVWRDGELTRGIPDLAPGMRLFHYGLRPPYYCKENQMELSVP